MSNQISNYSNITFIQPETYNSFIKQALIPSLGAFTWELEGNSIETSPYFSLRAHVPSQTSGVTIGRGYDLKMKSASEIISDLTAAGLPIESARDFAKARGIQGTQAKKYLQLYTLPQLTAAQELSLFAIEYNRLANDTKRIATKRDVCEKYGVTDWKNLNSKIKDVLIDLRYRGDYTPQTRTFLQRSVAENDFEKFSALMADRNNWPNVPLQRFNARMDYLSRK